MRSLTAVMVIALLLSGCASVTDALSGVVTTVDGNKVSGFALQQATMQKQIEHLPKKLVEMKCPPEGCKIIAESFTIWQPRSLMEVQQMQPSGWEKVAIHGLSFVGAPMAIGWSVKEVLGEMGEFQGDTRNVYGSNNTSGGDMTNALRSPNFMNPSTTTSTEAWTQYVPKGD